MRRIIPYSLILLPVFTGFIAYQLYFTNEMSYLFADKANYNSGSIFDDLFEDPVIYFTTTSIAFFFTAFIILLTIESLFVNLSRKWLVLPILYFGGFYAMLAYEITIFSTVKASDEHQNHRSRIIFDPSKHTLVTQGIGHWFVINYNIPVVFEKTALGREGYLAHRILPIEKCNYIQENNIDKIINGFSLRSLHFDGNTSKEYCISSNSEKPRGQTINVSRKLTPIDNILGDLNKVDFIIRDWADNEYTVSAGASPTLFPFPIPLLNCVPQDPPPNRLGCRFEFARFQGDPFKSQFEAEEPQWLTLANHLQLERVSIHGREIADTRRLMQELHIVAGASLANEFYKISRIIFRPERSVEDPDLRILTASPDFIALNADQITRGIRVNLNYHRSGEGNSSKNVQLLAQILAHTPKEKLVELGPRILALYEDADENDLIWQQTALLGAIGAIGESALPVILRAPEESWRQDQAKIAGICRVGHAALPEAEAFLSRMWEQDHAGDGVLTINVLYAAIRRTGMAMPEFHSRLERQERRLTRRFGDITPASDISVCDGALRH